ncbi:MAG TPA: DUF3618 domain-containing protein [Blastocatellia bacterium]|nr:DUF3618 domain-containing protein [Blastocatellia bacterium]
MAEANNVAAQRRAESDTPERSAEAIRQDIAAKRDSISETVDKLGERIHETFDWREYIGNYPWVALGLAAGVGFMVAGLFKREPSPRERIMDAIADVSEDFTDRLRDIIGDAVPAKKSGPTTMLKAALTATVSKAAMDFAKSKASELMAGNNRQPAQNRPTPPHAAGNLPENF